MASEGRARRPPGPRPDDAALVARVRDGDHAAYAELYRRYEPLVAGIVRARLGDQGDPADAVQDAFTAAWRHLGALRDPDQLRPWLAQIARRTAIDHGRRHRRRPVDADDDVLVRLPDPGPGPDDLSAATDLARRLDRGLRRLGHRDASAIRLSAHLGCGPAEIGSALGVSEGNAKVILHRARRRLRVAAGA